MMARRALIARGAFAGAASPDPSTCRLDPGADVTRTSQNDVNDPDARESI